MSARKFRTASATVALLALLSMPARASLTITPQQAVTGALLTDVWDAESGQSIPTNTAGYINGTLTAVDAGMYTFTYGPPGLVAGATGHGDSTFINEFWVGSNVFCTQAGDANCGGVATAVGASFSVYLNAGAIPFYFVANTSNVINNGDSFSPNNVGVYLVQIGLGTSAFAGPDPVAYLGLTDHSYPGADHDFQDMTVRVTEEAPEPLTLSLVGAGLAGVAAMRRRGKKPVG